MQVYTMVHHVVYEHTALLFIGHLDQILLSSLYGVCKVSSKQTQMLLPNFIWWLSVQSMNSTHSGQGARMYAGGQCIWQYLHVNLVIDADAFGMLMLHAQLIASAFCR